MRNLSKLAATLIAFTILASVFSFGGCTKENKDAKISVVVTTFPQYDWVRQIVGEKNDIIELTLLLDNGVDLHSYQPTAADIIKISSCDMFIYVGGNSDAWVSEVLKQSINKDMTVINLMEVLGDAVKEEETVEGMEPEKDEHEDEHEDEHAHVDEKDEHIWLSLRNAAAICRKIGENLEKKDEKNKEKYHANLNAYLENLSELDGRYKSTVQSATQKTLLFADRFPFRYLTDDYNLSYYAAFAGCSAESEASFETVTFLAAKIDELELKSVIRLEGSTDKLASTVIGATKNKNARIIVMDSLQSITAARAASITYLSVMENNLSALSEALN